MSGRSDWEINLELARRFNPTAIKYKSVKELINDRLKPAGVTFDELAEKGSWLMPPKGHHSKPYRRFEKGLLRTDKKPGFNTPRARWSSGRRNMRNGSLIRSPTMRSLPRARCGP